MKCPTEILCSDDGVFDLWAEPYSRTLARGRYLHTGVLLVQWALFWFGETFTVLRWGTLLCRCIAYVVVVQRLVALVVWHWGRNVVTIQLLTFSGHPWHSGLFLLHVGTLTLLQHGLHMISTPVDHKQRKDKDGEPQQCAYHDQLVPVRFGFHECRASFSWKDHWLLIGHWGVRRATNQNGALMLWLGFHTIICQELQKALFFWPACIGFLTVCLSHYDQPSIRGRVEKAPSTLAILPSSFSQVRAQLTGQDLKRVRWDLDHLTGK